MEQLRSTIVTVPGECQVVVSVARGEWRNGPIAEPNFKMMNKNIDVWMKFVYKIQSNMTNMKTL